MSSSKILYKFIDTSSPEYNGERMLRSKMLREPMGLPLGTEIFPFEDEAIHLVAMNNADVIGCVMFHPQGESGRLLQMAVLSKFQKMGIGRRLEEVLEKRLRGEGISEIHLHARTIAIPFYERLGFHIYGKPFEEVGIEHRLMKKVIQQN